MKEYIEAILHQEVEMHPYKEMQKLPLVCRNGYRFHCMVLHGQEALVAVPVEKRPLSLLRKQHHQIELYTGMPCVLYLTEMNYYSRDVMLKEGIPFVWEGHQIYLPFAGMLLDNQKRQAIRTYAKISFLTQKMLLTALYRGWQGMNVTKIAEALEVSKMSATRCFDEMEAMNIPYITVRSRARRISADSDKKTMWETVRPYLRNPVITTYAIKEVPDVKLPMAGTMALAHYSLLNEDQYPILAITKKNLKKIHLSADKFTPAGEIPGCMIQEMGYLISFEDGSAVDPLTVALGMSEEASADPRVSIAVDEMLERHVW